VSEVTRKIPAFAAILLTYAFHGVLFTGVRTELAYSFHHWLGDRARNLPSLTADFALPVLGPGALDGAPGVLFYVFWAFVFLPPAILAWRTWRDTDESATVRRFVYWGSCHGIATGIAYLLVLFGLWLPFSAA